jgi:hypothetical protein
MNFLTCARSGSAQTAVALCRHCSAGLCLDLVAETASFRGPGGFDLSSGHHTWARPRSTAHGRRPPESFFTPSS